LKQKGRLKETLFFYQMRRTRLFANEMLSLKTLNQLSNPKKTVAYKIFNGRISPETL